MSTYRGVNACLALCLNSALNVKALVGAFNQEKALVGVIDREIFADLFLSSSTHLLSRGPSSSSVYLCVPCVQCGGCEHCDAMNSDVVMFVNIQN